jgi:hypothetical protein
MRVFIDVEELEGRCTAGSAVIILKVVLPHVRCVLFAVYVYINLRLRLVCLHSIA